MRMNCPRQKGKKRRLLAPSRRRITHRVTREAACGRLLRWTARRTFGSPLPFSVPRPGPATRTTCARRGRWPRPWPPSDLAPRPRAGAALVAGSGGGGHGVLQVANRLWVDEGHIPNPSFLAELGLWPGAGVRAAPISRDPEEARALVNADVAATTRGLIPEIIGEGT